MKPMKIIPIEKYSPGLTPFDGLARCKAKKLGMITNAEADEILNGKEEQYKNFKDYFGCWTSTHIEHEAGATEAIVYNDGEKPSKIYFPLKDGWYKVKNRWGIPNGEPSDQNDPESRYLWRHQNRAYSGFVQRRFWGWGDDDRRFVYCVVDVSDCFGVLAIQRTPCKHKYKIVKTRICTKCNEEKVC